jgi:hypothetical protein
MLDVYTPHASRPALTEGLRARLLASMGEQIDKLGYEAKLSRASPVLRGVESVQETWQ